MKKVLILLLIALMILPTLMGCGEEKPENVTTKVVETTEYPYPDELPTNLRFQNEEVRFVIGETDVGFSTPYSEISIGVENYMYGDGNAVEDAVFTRNQNVEERLGVVIVPCPCNCSITENGAVYTDLLSGVANYDVVAGRQFTDSVLALKGMMLDLNKMDKYDADYIDLNQPYWSKQYTKGMNYQGKIYFATGELSLRLLGGGNAMFVNTTVYADAIEKNHGNIYDIVRQKKWTLDLLSEMAKEGFQDTGTVVGEPDKGDVLGFIHSRIDTCMGVGYGLVFSTFDPGGNPEISMESSDERLLSYINSMIELDYKSGVAMLTGADKTRGETLELFANGHALFAQHRVGWAEDYLSEMEQYGIIPCPLYQEGEDYHTWVSGVSVYGVYINCDNIPAATATLEAMAALSSVLTTPAYYDTALKYRYTRDEDSAEMIDLIRNGSYTDFFLAWHKYLSAMGYGIDEDFYSMVYNTTSGASVSKIKSQIALWEAHLESLLAELDQINTIQSQYGK